ncbi:uncharacterized protein LACBIDRAFT_300818 [Laccaria bicolor S238N-H82]|uniref:LYR motif-containing protein 2 n=1 Tax=Laccaria bicolor (strain S238N-H82 / ATCC MYA-4686) TaxID=486041 RepID=B0CQL9_LACBS|nr:uncharacterized protein LACBIDRAFT_300818 [Laccaria bicolor S238N-H82]EDR15669.1 predicted protein [Laccaria bicolor S238N-H82]|eukprot:XP_001873877.1 predicted protein [Laccaria bicolor S238N-H82]
MSLPTLKHFILKQQVLNLYRCILRASRSLPDPVTRRETVAWVRSEFERNRHLTDVLLIQDKLTLARREMRQILPQLR